MRDFAEPVGVGGVCLADGTAPYGVDGSVDNIIDLNQGSQGALPGKKTNGREGGGSQLPPTSKPKLSAASR